MGFSPFGFLFKALLFGLFLFLVIGLIRRILWGPRHWHYRHCGPPHPGRPPKGQEGEQTASDWGPWAWHRHHKHWGPPPWWGPDPESSEEDIERDSDSGNSEYAGPQE